MSNNKVILYTISIIDDIEGKGPSKTVFSSESEKVRDEYYTTLKQKTETNPYIGVYCNEKIVDIEKVCKSIFNGLGSQEKYILSEYVKIDSYKDILKIVASAKNEQ
jgi:hypothetical protein